MIIKADVQVDTTVDIEASVTCHECGEQLRFVLLESAAQTFFFSVQPCEDCIASAVEKAQACTCDGTEAKRGGEHYRGCPQEGRS